MPLATAPDRRASPRRSREARETRDRILDAATRLFSAADSRGASLRAIAREARVNPALVHYHFGTRERLLEETVLRALEPIQMRRRQMIEGLRRRPEPPSPDALARLFVEPLAARPTAPSAEEAMALRLLTRIFSEERRLAESLSLEHFGEVLDELGRMVETALPELPAPTRWRRIKFCVQAALETLSGPEMSASPEAPESSPDEAIRAALVSDLVDFVAGGLAAPPPRSSPSPAGAGSVP